jgi:hypothetical protein
MTLGEVLDVGIWQTLCNTPVKQIFDVVVLAFLAVAFAVGIYQLR